MLISILIFLILVFILLVFICGYLSQIRNELRKLNASVQRPQTPASPTNPQQPGRR